MTRQNFLQLALSLSVAGAALLLDGCGGGGGNGASGPGTTMTRGRLALPSGSSAGMRVMNGFGASAVSADGGFGVKALKNVPSIALVLDATGKLALLGFVDPGAASNVLDATSTAVALLFLALGGAQASLDDKAGLLRELHAEPAVATLATVVSARLTADPLALHNGDAQIQNALVSARDAVRAAHGGNRSRAIPGIKPVTRAEGLPPRMLVQPSGRQSGVEVAQDPARDGAVVPINHFRRWGKLFAYRVGFEDASGVRQDLPKAEALNNGDAFGATAPLGGVFTTLGELFSGGAAFAPVTGKTLPLTMKDGDAQTFIEIVALGSAFTQSEPEFFSAPRYAAQVPLWREARGRLNLISWMADIFFGLFMEVLGIRGAVADFAAYEAAAIAWEGIEETALRNIISMAKNGELPRAVAELVKLGIDDAGGRVIFQELAPASAKLLAYIAGEKVAVTEALWLAGFKALGGLLLAAPGVVMGAVDLGAVASDLSTANMADLWTATLIKPTVAITPSAVQLGGGQELGLTATIPGAASGAKFSYAWTLSGSNLASLRGENKSGASVETTTPTVTLTTTPSTQGTLTVTVTAYQLGDGGAKTKIGDAKSTIAMTDASTTRTVFLEKYDVTVKNSDGVPSTYHYYGAFLVFPLPAKPPSYYQITVSGQKGLYGGPDTYRIRSEWIGASGPENVPVVEQAKISASHTAGQRQGGWEFYRRGGNLYMYFDSFNYILNESGEVTFIGGTVFSGPQTLEGMRAELQRRGETFAVLYEQVP
jgi:hypothetical protein